ncbi:hypothetical protein B0H21DRAFT_827856 [Amylocystis lapponica]|nr:hypothetical protein B0H21DRAFT_827856 [Amylocystis lapponica]
MILADEHSSFVKSQPLPAGGNIVPPAPVHSRYTAHEHSNPFDVHARPFASRRAFTKEHFLRRRRFFKFLTAVACAWTLFQIVARGVAEVHHRFLATKDVPYASAARPKRQDGDPVECLNGYRWDSWGPTGFASFDLPVSADSLFVSSRGVLATGDIVIMQSQATTDVRVDISLEQGASMKAIESTSMCMLHRRHGEFGVAIMTPDGWPVRHEKLHFNVTVWFPRSSDASPFYIPTFETDLPHFTHHIGDLQDKVVFDHLILQSSDSTMSAESLRAREIDVRTTNGAISGSYHASARLSLSTSNADVGATINLYHDNADIHHNDIKKPATRLEIETSNGAIVTPMHLISTAASGGGGAFSIFAKSTDGPLALDVPSMPLDAVLRLDAETSNAAATVTVHRAFEGSVQLRTSRGETDVQLGQVEDPAGRGRKRQAFMAQHEHALDGGVGWDESLGGRAKGSLFVSSSNAPVIVRLPTVCVREAEFRTLIGTFCLFDP